MLRVLTLSTLFPDALRPTFGLFVERQTLGLAGRPGVEVAVVSGRAVPPWPLSLHPRARALSGPPAYEEWKRLPVHRPRFRAVPGLARFNGRALARAALPVARRLGCDVIDAEFFWPDGVAAMHLARALAIPFSIKARGSDVHLWGARAGVCEQMVEAARETGGLLAVSAAMKASMVALGMPEEKIAVHHTGVDLERFAPADRQSARQALGIEGPLLVAPGALIPLKGQRIAIEALARIPGATLLLVGDGPERPALERLARPLGGRVRFLGNRPHDELPGLLAAADALVLPSEREGLANVWVEALACGTPIVVPDVGGAREVVDRPEAGRIVPRTAEAIAAAVGEILADPPAQREVRRAAERFSWERNAEALHRHLTHIARHSRESGNPACS